MVGRIALIGTASVSLTLASLAGCAAVRLPNVALTPVGPAAAPAALGPFGADAAVTTRAEWEARRAPLLRAAFQAHVYGAMPTMTETRVVSRAVLAESAWGGRGRLENWVVAAGAGPAERRLNLAVALPTGEGPAPVIILQNFCGNEAALERFEDAPEPFFPAPSVCNNMVLKPLTTTIFGLHLLRPPFERLLDAGYAVAMFYASEVVPDDAEAAEPVLRALTPPGTPDAQRTGAVAGWAWAYSRALDALSGDRRIDAGRATVWGHSRFGKAALLAAAFDARISAAVALQPGTGGAALTRDEVGEQIGQITESYPHWFAPVYAGYAGREAELPVDQHQLIALIAPRRVLIGAARRDQWADPHGMFRALQGAEEVYRLYGEGMGQSGLRDFAADRALGYFLRGGLHGVHQSDWLRTIEFLDAGRPAPQN